jgi:hypothetical protein
MALKIVGYMVFRGILVFLAWPYIVAPPYVFFEEPVPIGVYGVPPIVFRVISASIALVSPVVLLPGVLPPGVLPLSISSGSRGVVVEADIVLV